MQKFLLLTLSIFCFSLFAQEAPPEIPTPGEDTKLFLGESAEQFFVKREGKSTCRKTLEEDRNAFRTAESDLKKLINSKAPAEEIDEQERTMESARTEFLESMEKCGECATQRLGSATIQPPEKRVQYWYVTDGSCLARNLNPTQLEQYYQNMKAILLDTGKYARHHQGFPGIVEFFGMDMATGAKLPPGPVPTAVPFKAFIAISGPLNRAYNYVVTNRIEEKQTGDLKEFILTFHGEKAPENYQKEIYFISASGKKTKMPPYWLSDVKGMWYFNNKGYSRYFTAADFRTSMGFILEDLARKTLLSTVVNLKDRSLPE
jgi:hypothetical protein